MCSSVAVAEFLLGALGMVLLLSLRSFLFFDNSLCNIHAQGVANTLPRAALTEGATIRYRDRAMGVGKTRAARHSHTSGCILQDCEKETALSILVKVAISASAPANNSHSIFESFCDSVISVDATLFESAEIKA